MLRSLPYALVFLGCLALACERGGVRVGGGAGGGSGFRGGLQIGVGGPLPGAVRGAAEDELPHAPVSGQAWVEQVPGTAIELVMRPVAHPDGTSMWVMEREVTWNLFDIFIFRLDEKKGKSTPTSDAVTRPTKPYIAVDRGFGHDGYPALSMSLKGALQFAEWLSAKTGRTYRVPTVAEWDLLCAQAKIPTDDREAYAWCQANSGEVTHPVASKKADGLGLYDLYGNVGEWCLAGGTVEKPVGVLKGGSFETPLGELDCATSLPYSFMWNDSDPQFPKSIWWLADAAFVGMRLICVEPTTPNEHLKDPKEKTHE